MRISITQALVRKLGRGNQDIYDIDVPGLVLRTRASGRHTYRVLLKRGRWFTLGRVDSLTPAEARDLARLAFGDVARGKDPVAERRKARAGTLAQFLDGPFKEWAIANRKTAAEMVARVKSSFPDLLSKGLHEITPWAVERWRTQRHKDDVAPATTNRDLDSLRSALAKAVEWNVIQEHPLRKVKRAKVDTTGRLRYLSDDEETRLRKQLELREQRHREARASFNSWRTDRGLTPLPDYGRYTDHLQPVVILALNTGLRRGELLSLRWSDIDLRQATLTVRGTDSKSGKTRHVPLNQEANEVLKVWQPDTVESEALVFPGPNGERMQSLKTAWSKVAEAAGLTGFTFHDLRHTFASRLVQRGVDLNTVRELLGHADIKMTLRYSHLAPENKAAAVALLGRQATFGAGPARETAAAKPAE